MTETSLTPVSSAEELDALEHELAVGLERLADLRKRARVLEIESENWVKPPSRAPVFGFGLQLVVASYIIPVVAGLWLGIEGPAVFLHLIRMVLAAVRR
jgi:hypothetical protein